MINTEFISEFNSILKANIAASTMVKLSLGNYNGNEKELKNIYIKKVKIKRTDMLSFNYRYKTRDIFKNHPWRYL